VLCYLVNGLGILFLMLTPKYAGSFTSRGGVEYMGAVLFLVFLGLLNLARIKSEHHSARTVAIVANLIAAAYLLFASVVVQDPEAIGVSVPVIVLCCTSYLHRTNENKPTPGMA